MSLNFRPKGTHERPFSRRQPLYEGEEKILFMGPEANTCILYFTDHSKRQEKLISGKGAINNRLSELFMRRMAEAGLANHYLKQLNMREQLVRTTDVIPLMVETHNVAVGPWAERLGLAEGTRLSRPIMELRYKSKDLNHPYVSPSHALALNWANEDEVEDILSMAQRANDFLMGQFMAVGLRLLNFRLEFGRYFMPDFMDGMQIIIIDEISPDTFEACPLDADPMIPLKGPEMHQEIARRFGVLAPEISPELSQEISHGDASK